ncbi:MAG: Dabb family protein [Planctomycetota bacterium]|nr:Dabb family protein [Planctomycetota bacterium]
MSALRMLIAATLFTTITACAATRMPPSPAHINHVVYFKLKNPADAAEMIADCNNRLATIPSIRSCFVGTHYDIGRDNIDSDYDVALYVGFDTEAGYIEYLDHPIHLDLVGKWRPRWEWIRIHDVENLRP